MPHAISRPLGTAVVALFVLGVAVGPLLPGQGGPAPEHDTSANAWPLHLVLTGLAVVALALGAWRWRSGRGSGLYVLAPVGRRAELRLGRTARTSPLRLVVVVPLLAFVAYLVARCGMQVTMGIDPAFTMNAWGGPTYAGAMYAHYLDAALMGAVALGLVSLVLVPAPERPGQVRDRRSAGSQSS
ncbi:MAG: hypothetical protein ACTHXO_03395 [Actinomycetaceae bacterium]